MALAHVALMSKRKEIAWDSIAEKLNGIDWGFNNDMWYNILVIGSANKKMITGKESIRSAGAVISYMVIGG
jgi:DNA sulfur modification protein DndB